MLTETSIRLTLSKELKNELDRAAKKYGLTRLGLIRLALVEWLDQKLTLETFRKEEKKRDRKEKQERLEKLYKMEEDLDKGKLKV